MVAFTLVNKLILIVKSYLPGTFQVRKESKSIQCSVHREIAWTSFEGAPNLSGEVWRCPQKSRREGLCVVQLSLRALLEFRPAHELRHSRSSTTEAGSLINCYSRWSCVGYCYSWIAYQGVFGTILAKERHVFSQSCDDVARRIVTHYNRLLFYVCLKRPHKIRHF